MIRSASCRIRDVVDVCEFKALVPGVSIRHRSERMGWDDVGSICSWDEFVNVLAVPTSLDEILALSSAPIRIVTASVVGNTPDSNSSFPSKALMRVLFPALNSPANTTVNKDGVASFSLSEASCGSLRIFADCDGFSLWISDNKLSSLTGTLPTCLARFLAVAFN